MMMMSNKEFVLMFWALLLALAFEPTCSFVILPTASPVRMTHLLHMSTDDPSASEALSKSPEESTEPPKPPVKCPDCDLCDGSGRIEGGIGLVLKWWPIKAYRPCPNFIENGGFYQRSGQGLDEIAFGRDSTFDVDK